jgi:hypothetical protein
VRPSTCPSRPWSPDRSKKQVAGGEPFPGGYGRSGVRGAAPFAHFLISPDKSGTGARQADAWATSHPPRLPRPDEVQKLAPGAKLKLGRHRMCRCD